MAASVALRHIRLTTKTRPHDRFVTAQYRASRTAGEGSHDGAFFVVVEITNPWFPNAQIGQTIINTILREYRRGEHASPLQNFEIALRKTNEVLTQITQTGETDWIGNLTSVIALSHRDHLYLAQTGKARSYLYRGGKLIDLADGLETDEAHHPLTTYTNITSGTLELGDRLVFGSSLLGESLSQPDLKAVLASDDFHEAGRGVVRSLQAERVKLLAGFVLEVIALEEAPDEPITLYLDQSLDHPAETIRRVWKHHLAPQIKRGSAHVGRAARGGLAWSRDWLIPRLLNWGTRSGQAIHRGSRRVAQATQPVLTSAWSKVRNKLPPRLTSVRSASQPAARDPVRVHHYSQAPRRTRTNAVGRWFSARGLKSLQLPGLPIKIKLTKKQLIALTMAVVVILVIVVTARARRTTQQTEIATSAAETALVTARQSQAAAERAFILGQEETAKTQYLAAIAAARTARGSTITAADATVILQQSQTLIDQLMHATRVELIVPSLTLVDVPAVLASVGATRLAIVGKDVYEGDAAGTMTKTASLTSEIVGGSTEVVVDGLVFIPAADSGIWQYSPSDHAATAATLETGSWETGTALANFGSTLYLLDPTKGQIWKYTPSNGRFTAPRPYFATADPAALTDVLDFAIDGDLYTLGSGGAVTKYTRGTAETNWQLSGVPTPWDSLTVATAVFAHPDADRLYVFESKTDAHPARLVRFGRDGVFAGQLLFPDDWDVNLLHWQPTSKTGLVAVGSDVYEVSWTE